MMTDLVLAPNFGAGLGIEDAEGYIVAVPRRYATYWNTVEPESVRTVAVDPLRTPAALSSPLVDAASIRWLASRWDVVDELEKAGAPSGSWVLRHQEGDNRLFENTEAFAPARVFSQACFVASPTAEAEHETHTKILQYLQEKPDRCQTTLMMEGAIPPKLRASSQKVQVQDLSGLQTAPSSNPPRIQQIDRRPETVRIELEPGDDAFLLLTDGFDPGWNVTIDGQPVSLYPANVAFRGVHLPAGARLVEMSYRPRELTGALALSSCGLAIWIALLIVAGIQTFQRRRHSSTPVSASPASSIGRDDSSRTS